MFAQHTYIEEAHKPVLESVIRQHHVVTEKLLAKLYEVALESFKTGGAIPAQPGISWSFVGDADRNVVASATDEKTGIYVQLTGTAGGHQRMMTVGAKWAMQARNQQALVTKLW